MNFRDRQKAICDRENLEQRLKTHAQVVGVAEVTAGTLWSEESVPYFERRVGHILRMTLTAWRPLRTPVTMGNPSVPAALGPWKTPGVLSAGDLLQISCHTQSESQGKEKDTSLKRQ